MRTFYCCEGSYDRKDANKKPPYVIFTANQRDIKQVVKALNSIARFEIESGGTEGGIGSYTLGFILAGLAAYLFFDSVRVSTAGYGLFTGYYTTVSMGIVFVPFFLGVLALFYNAKWKWAWWLMWGGVAILAIEILSRIRFLMYMKTTYLMGMLVLFAAGVALILKSYKGKDNAS